MMPDDPRYLYTLGFVNGIRAALDRPPLDELPPGEHAHGTRCPVARSFEDIDSSPLVVGPWSRVLNAVYDHPHPVEAFIRAFDNGDFPELVGGRG